MKKHRALQLRRTKERKNTSRIVSTLRVNNVPREYGRTRRGGGVEGKRKVTVHSHPWSPGFISCRCCPESLSVSLVLPLFIARARGCVPCARYNAGKRVGNRRASRPAEWKMYRAYNACKSLVAFRCITETLNTTAATNVATVITIFSPTFRACFCN